MQKTKTEWRVPPPHLSERSKALWLSIVKNESMHPGQFTILQTALESLDRADEASAEIKKHGLTTVTKRTGAIHVNPLVKIEREARQQFLKCAALLRLQYANHD